MTSSGDASRTSGPRDRPGESPLVLVMEDDPSVRGLLQTLLAAEGYRVSTASDGLAGLESASAHVPALIMLDLMMPDLGGAQVLEALQDDPRLRSVPVLVVTGQSDAAPRLRAALGEDRIFVKPFAVAELLHRVADLTGRSL